MGRNLTKWAGRIAGLYSLTPLEQVVLLTIANAAYDYGTNDKEQLPGVCFMSREELATRIYNDVHKARYLDRPIATLRKAGLIEPTGKPARRGHIQEYKLRVNEAVALNYDTLQSRYRGDAAELGRIQRAFRK